MSKKLATVSTAAETATSVAEWNEKWLRRLSMTVSYPCASVIAVSFALSVICRNAWLTLPGIAMILYGAVYLNFIRDHTSAAWRNWVTRHRNSSNLPKGLWRTHSRIHAAFVKRQKAFLRGTFVLSAISYIGAFIVCECTYPGDMALSEITPSAVMFRMILWSAIAAILSLWISYIITRQKWVRNDAWDEVERETHNVAEDNLN